MRILRSAVAQHLGNCCMEGALWALAARVWNVVVPLFALSVSGTFIYSLGTALARPSLRHLAEEVLPQKEMQIGRFKVTLAGAFATPASSFLGSCLAVLSGYSLAFPLWGAVTYGSFMTLMALKVMHFEVSRSLARP